MIVYKATNLVNGKLYIGQTTRSLENRKNGHRKDCIRGRVTPFSSAIRKYGFGNFAFEPVYQCFSKAELDEKECEFIKSMNTKVPNGYNLSEGGGGPLGYKRSAVTIQKMRMAMTGHQVSEETRQKIRIRHIGKKMSEESCQKMAESQMGNKNSLGHKHTEETKEKLRIAATGNKNCVGRKLTEMQRLALIRANIGKPRSDETKEKLRIAMMGNKHGLGKHCSVENRIKLSALHKGNKYNLGRKLTDEEKAKISAFHKNRKRSEITKAKMKASWLIRKQGGLNHGHCCDEPANNAGIHKKCDVR